MTSKKPHFNLDDFIPEQFRATTGARFGEILDQLSRFQHRAKDLLQRMPHRKNLEKVVNVLETRLPQFVAASELWAVAQQNGLIPHDLQTSLDGLVHILQRMDIAIDLPAIQIIFGAVFATMSICQCVRSHVKHRYITAKTDGIVRWTSDYQKELNSAKSKVASRVSEIVQFFDEQQRILTNAERDDVDANLHKSWSRRTTISHQIKQLKHGLIYYENLIESGQKQLNVIQDAIDREFEKLGRDRARMDRIMKTGGILIAVGVVTAVATGGATIPLILASAGAVATLAAAASIRITAESRAALTEAQTEVTATLAVLRSHRHDCDSFFDELKEISDTSEEVIRRAEEVQHSVETRQRMRDLQEENDALRRLLDFRLDEREEKSDEVSSMQNMTSVSTSTTDVCQEGWLCNACTFINQDEAECCEMCLTSRRPNKIVCSQCTVVNENGARSCFVCDSRLFP